MVNKPTHVALGIVGLLLVLFVYLHFVGNAAWYKETSKVPQQEAVEVGLTQIPVPENSPFYGCVPSTCPLPAIAGSFFGEAGYNNLRGSGSVGFLMAHNHRLKFTGEFLAQKLQYDHPHEKKWDSQYALGGKYQCVIRDCAFQSIDLGAAYAHAFSKKEIAGSNGFFTYAGSSVYLSSCSTFSFAINYDHVGTHRKSINGWGGSLNFVQHFAKYFTLNLDVEFREPFNTYQGALNWNRTYSGWGVTAGVFGNFTDGKRGLRDILTGGLQGGVTWGGKKESCKDSDSCYSTAYCDLSNWVKTPAVYIPVVLSMGNHKKDRTSPFDAPAVVTQIPDFTGSGADPLALNSFFSGNDLHWSVSVEPAAHQLNYMIDQSGNLTITPSSGDLVTIIVSNSLGVASQTFTVLSN